MFFSTPSKGWNLECSCSWPWTAMWPSATLYALLLCSPILSLPRWVSHLPLRHDAVIPFTVLTKRLLCAKAIWFSIPTLTTCLWPELPCGNINVNAIYGHNSCPPDWEALTSVHHSHSTPWSSRQCWACPQQRLSKNFRACCPHLCHHNYLCPSLLFCCHWFGVIQSLAYSHFCG